MRDAAQAYKNMSKQVAEPRDLEAKLLLEAARRLQAAHDAWEYDDPGLDGALLYNRKLWTIFLTSVTREDNPLPAMIRQNVANLGLFVMNQTIVLMTAPKREQLGPLININREVAAGLMRRA